MIIDEIIAVLFSIFGLLFEGLSIVIAPLVNLIALGIELIICLLLPDFKLGRMKRYKRGEKHTKKENTFSSFLGFAVLIGGLFLYDLVSNRGITLIANDGHTLPFAAVIVYESNGPNHMRSDNAGKIEISRFGTEKIEINDSRYIKKEWIGDEISSILEVERTILGSGLDKLAEKLLKKAKP